MSKTRRGRGGVNQGNHNTGRYTNRGRGYRGTSGGHHNNNNYRDQGTKPEGIYHNHCILAALSHLLGQTVHVRSKNDSVYEGIFTTISPRASFVLKCVHKIDKKQVNGFTGDLSQPLPHKDSVRREIVFEFDDIISVAGKIEKTSPPVQKGNLGPEGFIDSEVNKRRGRGNERKELQRWTDNSISENLDNLSLDTETGNGGWTYEDMIRTNEEKFNVASMYDENMDEYTTPIPSFDEEVRKKAALLAEEIESRSTSNVHVAEERGQIVPIDVSEEDRYSAVVRPGLDQEFIEIQTNNKGRYTTDIPAPLSQVDEPTEELFKEEKEALKKQKETLESPAVITEPKKISESEIVKKTEPEPLKKCVAIETQTEPNSPKHHKKPASALSPMPKITNSPKSSPTCTVASPQIQTDPTPQTETTTMLNNETPPKSPNVQHTATQVINQKREKVEEVWKKDENVQKKIMKSERSYQSHRKASQGDHKEEMSGLMNFKTKYEDSTQYKTKSPVTIAQSTAAPSQLIQPSSQQPVAVPQMIAKQRNDSMSSVGESTNHGGHASQYQRPSVQGIQILQHQQQQQQQMMHIQMQQQMQHQMQLQQHMAQAQHQQVGHQQALAVQHNMQAIQMQQMVAFQQQRQQHQMHQQHHQQIQHHQNQQQAQLQIDNNKFNLNPDAMEFKPGSGPPTPSQYSDKNNNMVVMPQAVAVIPTPVRQSDMAVIQQNNIQGGALIGQYGHPSLVLYPSNPLLSRGYIPAVSMPMQPNHNAHNQMVPEQSQQPTGIMSPTSPTPAGPQLIYHHNPQIVSQPQYQSQIHPQMVHAAAASQFLQLQSQNGPYANPLQPHSGHGGAVMNTLFPYAHPPNVG